MRPPRSKSFHAVHACSRHCLASSGRSCDIRTEARAWRASGCPGSVCRAIVRSSSHVFSASGSKLGYIKKKKKVLEIQSTHHKSYEGSIHISTCPIRALTMLAFNSVSLLPPFSSSARSFPLSCTKRMLTAA